MNLRKRIALLLILIMVLTLIPTVSFAAPPVGPCDGRDAIRNGGNHFWTITGQQDPDCFNAGYVSYRCVYCNETYTDTVPALGHDWMGPETVKEPTCTEEGVNQYVCRRNSDHTFTKAVPALGHDWSEWYVLKAPTLTEEGILERKCQRCGITEQMPIPMLGQKEQYDLTLIMTQMSPSGQDLFDYEALMDEETGGILITYQATLINTGTDPLNVLDYTGGTGQSSQLPSTVTLYPGEYANVSLPWSLGPEDILPGSASETLFGATEFDFFFFGDSFDGEDHVCVSNTESFDYQVKDPEGYTGWPIPSESAVAVDKTLLSSPADPNGFQLGETLYYNLYVQNVGDVAIQGLTLLDSMYGYPEEVIFSTDLEPGEGKAPSLSHVVGPDDVNAGFVSNRALARWADPDSAEAMEERSEPVIVAVINKASLVLRKSVLGSPNNGQYYVPGETVHFQVDVLNNSALTQKAIVVVDPLVGESRTCPDMAPGDTVTLYFDYVITELDALMTYVDNYAYAMEVDNAVSNTVRVNTGMDAVTGLTVTKAETSAPADPKGYQLGETITYSIVVTNVGETLLLEGTVCDSLQGGGGEIGAFENLYPGTSRTYSFYHIVDEQDIHDKKVVNQAAVWYSLDGHGAVQASNLVESPTWGEDPYGFEWEEEPLLGGDDCCNRTLTGKGTATDAFTVHFCAEHGKLLDELEETKAAAASEAEYLQTARAAWQQAMDEMYLAAQEKAGSEAAAALMNQRLAWLEYMDTYEALLTDLYPDEPLTVVRELLRETENKCVDLCYELHTAPQARVDSVLGDGVAALEAAAPGETCVRAEGERDGSGLVYTEVLCVDHSATDERIGALVKDAVNRDARTNAFLRAQRMWETMMNSRTNARYKAADKDARAVVAKNRLAFDKYVAARKALLDVLYPDQPDVAAQIVARVIQDKEMDLCKLWK